MTTSVIIPSKNELYLPHLINDIHTHLLSSHEIRVQEEDGLSNAVLRGVKSAIGDVIVVLDADGSHNPKYISKMMDELSFYDIVIGSRYVRGGKSEDYRTRQLISRLLCKISRTLLGLNISDTMSGFVVAKREVFEQLHLRPFGYKFALEMMILGKHKFKIGECPVVFEKRKMGYSKTDLLQGVRTLTFIFKLWLWRMIK